MNDRDLDFQLIERIQNGEQLAFTLLVKKYQGRVANILLRYISNQADIADVTQDVFIKVYKSLFSFKGNSAFYTWLYRITVNTAKNYLTSRNRRPPAFDIDIEDAENVDNVHAMTDSESPENLLHLEQVKVVVIETIESLPDELKSAITLREIEGMSYAEIADIEMCPVGTVRSRIFRAREIIDANLKPLLEN
ncbi:MAG TPA: RNA polymerase sigma factor RpoE [Psychromonas hadalis]|nr:RNA polymerase sigma factor RpoE [Psychromonas hadalis]